MDYEFVIDGRAHRISLESREGKVTAVRDARRIELEVQQAGSQTFSLLVDKKSYEAHVARLGGQIYVSVGAGQFCLTEAGQDSRSHQAVENALAGAEATIKAPMPGMVIKVNVVIGSEVSPGDRLVVVEAMKMEHEMRAAYPATVEKIFVSAGQQVEAFQSLVELKAREPLPRQSVQKSKLQP